MRLGILILKTIPKIWFKILAGLMNFIFVINTTGVLPINLEYSSKVIQYTVFLVMEREAGSHCTIKYYQQNIYLLSYLHQYGLLWFWNCLQKYGSRLKLSTSELCGICLSFMFYLTRDS